MKIYFWIAIQFVNCESLITLILIFTLFQILMQFSQEKSVFNINIDVNKNFKSPSTRKMLNCDSCGMKERFQIAIFCLILTTRK